MLLAYEQSLPAVLQTERGTTERGHSFPVLRLEDVGILLFGMVKSCSLGYSNLQEASSTFLKGNDQGAEF